MEPALALTPSSALASGANAAAKTANAAGASTQPRNEAAIRKTANEFEAMFLAEYMKIMFEGTEASEPFGGGSAEASFRPMLLDEYAKGFAKQGGIGLADAVAREMIALQASNAAQTVPTPTTPVEKAR
jgi:peptidoglycan hydrolase FlgJ